MRGMQGLSPAGRLNCMAWPAIGSGKSVTPCAHAVRERIPGGKGGRPRGFARVARGTTRGEERHAREWTARQDAIATCSSHVAPKSCGRAVTAVKRRYVGVTDLDEAVTHSYSRANSSAYLSYTTERLTLSVGVSSPPTWVRSWSRIAKRLICSIRANFWLIRSTSRWSSAWTCGSVGDGRRVGGDAQPAGQLHRLVAVECQHRDEILALVAVDDRLGDVTAVAQLALDVHRSDVLAARGDDDVLLAPGDREEAIVTQLAQIAREEPSVDRSAPRRWPRDPCSNP